MSDPRLHVSRAIDDSLPMHEAARLSETEPNVVRCSLVRYCAAGQTIQPAVARTISRPWRDRHRDLDVVRHRRGLDLAEQAVKTFRKNTLATVVVQLRFHPILKTTEHYADFQEKLRPRFPGYEAVETQTFEMNFGPAAGPAGIVRSEKAHRFLAVDEPTVAALDTTSVSIEYAAHKERATLINDFALVLDALKAYGPVPVRLGLRYVNVIDQGSW